MSVGKVGSKGELFPPKELREKLKLKPNKKVLYHEKDGMLVVEPLPTLEELLEADPAIEISLEEFHESRRDLSRRAEE